MRNISTPNTKLKTWFRMSNTVLSKDQGGMFGLSIAKVMQLDAMKTKTIKSNQAFPVKEVHLALNLKVENYL